MDTQTPEQIAQHYKAAMDSVALINSVKPEGMEAADWAEAFIVAAFISIFIVWGTFTLVWIWG